MLLDFLPSGFLGSLLKQVCSCTRQGQGKRRDGKEIREKDDMATPGNEREIVTKDTLNCHLQGKLLWPPCFCPMGKGQG